MSLELIAALLKCFAARHFGPVPAINRTGTVLPLV